MSDNAEPDSPAVTSTDQAECPRCGKPPALCVCDGIAPVSNRVALLILQHPQEQDRLLGTAQLTVQHLDNAVRRIGLSWPSLSKALGRPVADPARWAVLYLGSVKPADLATDRRVVAVDRKGVAEPDQRRGLGGIEGLVVLDGTWSQAKALWWRNPWLLKCRRIVLNPKAPSRYGKLRREPRREGLSTIEAVAQTLAEIEKRPEIETTLNAGFERLLAKIRALPQTAPDLLPRAKPRGGRRPRRR